MSRQIMMRRDFIARVGMGLAGGMLAGLLGACTSATPPAGQQATTGRSAGGPTAGTVATAGANSPAATLAPATLTSTTATTGDTLKILSWQAPTLINPVLGSLSDQVTARLCCEPLLTGSPDGTLSPVLAAEVPSRANGGLSADGQMVTYKLKPNVRWADGQPFTADDVVFTFEFITNKETGAASSLSRYVNVGKVEALDRSTVRLTFKTPAGGWFVPFSGQFGQILPKHALQEYVGASARSAPFNLKPFGTGPFAVKDFTPGDMVTLIANPYYRESGLGKPFFKTIQIKGGGDPVSAARAVLETGEYDYAWLLQVEAQVLNQIQQGGKGALVTAPGYAVETLLFNFADPNNEVDGERSSPNSHHPFLTDLRVRQALALSVDRSTIARQLFGQTGDATANLLTMPTSFQSPNTRIEFDVARANQILDEAGYVRAPDGIRMTPGGVRMSIVLQTTLDALRQKEQALMKDGWQKIGVDTQIKSVNATIYTSISPTADTVRHFNADMELAPVFPDTTPQSAMKQFYCGDPVRDWAQKSNGWSASNWVKWSDPTYNQRFDQVLVETDPEKARQVWIQMNDQLVNSYVAVPLVDRKIVEARSNSLRGPAPAPFDSQFAWNIADWTRA